MMVPKGDVFYQFRKDVHEGKLPADLVAKRSGEVLRPSNFAMVRGLVRFRGHGHPYQ